MDHTDFRFDRNRHSTVFFGGIELADVRAVSFLGKGGNKHRLQKNITVFLSDYRIVVKFK